MERIAIRIPTCLVRILSVGSEALRRF